MRLPVILFVLCITAGSAYSENENICSFASCRCSPGAHPSWLTVNCTVPKAQRFSLQALDLPPSTSDLTISGGEVLLVNRHSLNGLSDVRQIFFHHIQEITLRKFTAVGLSTINLYIEIDNCDVLKIEEKAFNNIKGPISIEISNCDTVSIEGEAFSWLLMINITNVRQLNLNKGSFTLDPSAGNVGDHGPGMSIYMSHMQIPDIPTRTFGSSAASVVMQAVDIGTIRQGAFSANTYNIVMAINCSIQLIEAEAFAQKSLINSLNLDECNIHELAPNAMSSAVVKMNITGSIIDIIHKGAINATVVAVTIIRSTFHRFEERGFVLTSWNKIYMRGNKFDVLSPNAISGFGGSIYELVFTENEIETVNPGSLGFIGPAFAQYPSNVFYKYNYYGNPCTCNITSSIAQALRVPSADYFSDQSYCTVDYFFAVCFNVPEKNVKIKTFTNKICTTKPEIQCEEILSKKAGAVYKEIPNPRFPHQPNNLNHGLKERDKKVIGIVIVTAFGCIVIVMIISFIRWMRRRGHCLTIKNALISSNASCVALCNKMNICLRNNADNTRSMSELTVVEYSEHQRLNEPRTPDASPEPTPSHQQSNNAQFVAMADKITQTLPEELTRELLENLKIKLEDPENYKEARELIEHLYDLIKFEDNSNAKIKLASAVENIYELPFQNTAPRVGKNKKTMRSIGTKTPSIENLLALSPYHRRTALAHEYFEPKDFAVHLYAEIINYDKEKKPMLGDIPDVIAQQGMPRGPYLRAVCEKTSTSSNNTPTGKMFNRPLPQKPTSVDSGEGTSVRLD